MGYCVKIYLNFKGSLTAWMFGLFENSNKSSVGIVTAMKGPIHQFGIMKIRVKENNGGYCTTTETFPGMNAKHSTIPNLIIFSSCEQLRFSEIPQFD